MSWTYDASGIGTSTSAERLNFVRFLIGDTDTDSQQLQDEEIASMLSEVGDEVYSAAELCCRALASKYARKVDSSLESMSRSYSQLQSHYHKLAQRMSAMASSQGSVGMGSPVAGGISVDDMNSAELDTDRVAPAFKVNQFDNPNAAGGADGLGGGTSDEIA